MEHVQIFFNLFAHPASTNNNSMGEKQQIATVSSDNNKQRYDKAETNNKAIEEAEEKVNFAIDDGSASDSSEGAIAGGEKMVEGVQKTANLKQTIAGIAGNVLEWYDFAVFGYFSDVIGVVFFPEQSGNAAMVQSFAVFGGAFLMRPFGGLLMGYIGDKYGRKRALELSIFLMAFPTFAMGCLPSYEMIGWLAIVLLVIVRLLQGVSVGGQLVASLVFTLETHPNKDSWGYYGSFVLGSANFGSLLGGLMGYCMRYYLSYDDLISWGWRVPFLMGICVSLSGFYLKHSCEEVQQIKVVDNPIYVAFLPENRRALISACLVPMLWSTGFYLSFVWMAIFMTDLIDPPVQDAFLLNCVALFLSVCCMFPICGILSDIFGRTTVMTVGGIAIGFLGPIFMYVATLGNPYAIFILQNFLGFAVSCWGAPMCAWLVEMFPPEVRLTAVAVGYNVAQATMGGLTPAIATLMVGNISPASPGIIYIIVAILSLIGLWTAPKRTDLEPLRLHGGLDIPHMS